MNRHITKDDLGPDGYLKDTHLIVRGSITVAAGIWLRVRGGIEAGEGIKAGGGIEAGWGIKAGRGIEAGGGIEAGWGIEAGLSITAKWIACPLRIFAGLCLWRLPTPAEMEVRAEVRSGTVAYGVVKPLDAAGGAQ